MSELSPGAPHAVVGVGLHLANVAAGAVALAGWAGVLPPIAAGFGIVLYGIQIWESETVRGLVGRLLRRERAG